MKRFILHWIAKKSDSLFLHFSCSQMLPVFLHLVFFSWSSSQTSWTVFDTNCLCTPTCPPCLPSPTHRSGLCCLRGNRVCLWLILGQMPQISFHFAEQHVLFIFHYCWSVGVDKNWQIWENSHYCHYSLRKIHYLTFSALWKAARFWIKPLELLSHFRDLAWVCDLELLVFKRKALSSPTEDCRLCKITAAENLPRHGVIATWACIFQHRAQSAAACWPVNNSLFHLSPARTQIICIHKEFVMIINDTLSLYNHLYCGISYFSGSNWQERISWESWARGTKGRYRKF